MNSIKRKVCDYKSPQSILLKVEQEGLLCTSTYKDLDGNHEGFGTKIDFTWTTTE